VAQALRQNAKKLEFINFNLILSDILSLKTILSAIVRFADPDWIRIQSGQWIRIRDPDPDPGGQK
jgi:hypothetical protein